MNRYRCWCFTLNNPDSNEREFWKRLTISPETRRDLRVKYLIYQEEQGIEGTTHYQGYIELLGDDRKTMKYMKETFGSRLHLERRRGTQSQAILYCKKTGEDGRITNGEHGEGGECKKGGTDKLSIAAPALRNGADMNEMRDDYCATYVKYGSKLRAYFLELKPKRTWAPKIIIYYGKTGTGKSATARLKFPDAYWVPWPRVGGWWWPRYEGQKTIILDEFSHQIKFHTLLALLDRYPFDIQEKGNNMDLLCKRIVITTNIAPAYWYKNKTQTEREPMFRRFKDFAKIYHFEDDSTWDNIKNELIENAKETGDCPWDYGTTRTSFCGLQRRTGKKRTREEQFPGRVTALLDEPAARNRKSITEVNARLQSSMDDLEYRLARDRSRQERQLMAMRDEEDTIEEEGSDFEEDINSDEFMNM